jgi:glycosyltransferase involved in cell wall biosynthesis
VCFGGIALTEIERETMSQLHIPDDSIQVVFGDDVKLSEYYASADAMVYPSLYEGFGIPLLEAMGCGCPVICSNTSSLPEVAGDAAMYFDPEDVQDIAKAMLRVVQLSDDRPKMIARGKLRAQQFSWDVCAQQTFAVYERLLARQ